MDQRGYFTDHFELAQRFIGIEEIKGTVDNPMIMSMLKLDNEWPEGDEVPWCSAFVNYICWLVRAPRSKNLRARSWLRIGSRVGSGEAKRGDIVVLKRGAGTQPGPEVIDAPGHVGFFAGISEHNRTVELLGGNQSDTVNVTSFPMDRILSIRRI